MKHSQYPYRSEESFELFEFTSEGPKGKIKKIVAYTETSTANVYNLGFGDFDENTHGMNDLSVTNNGDSMKVLATVASTVYAFFDKHPRSWIFVTGSTQVRTRLYRMGIANNLPEITKDFIVLGYKDQGEWKEFIIGEDYDAFLITKKEINL